MVYRVTYRLLHPAYFPVTRTSEIVATTRGEQQARLALLIEKWRIAGYTVQVLAVAPRSTRR